MEEVVFFGAAIGALGGAIAVVGLRNPFYSVLALVVHLISLAVLFLLLHSEFVAAAQVVVYAGAVMVLYVFVAAYVGGIEEPVWEPIPGQRLLAPLLGAALFVELSIAVLGSSLKALGTDGPQVADGFGAPSRIGTLMLEKYLIPFEAASLLLLIAAVGAVVLAARRRSSDGNEASYGVPLTPRELALSGGIGGVGGAPPDTQRAAPSWIRDRQSLLSRRRARRGRPRHSPGGARVSVEWYVVLSALLFAIGAGGVLIRRSPVVILLCLELMLNAGNLALVAFSRMTGNESGQIFALIVMVVAACEVVVGLGLIVAIFRRRLPLNVDELRELKG